MHRATTRWCWGSRDRETRRYRQPEGEINSTPPGVELILAEQLRRTTAAKRRDLPARAGSYDDVRVRGPIPRGLARDRLAAGARWVESTKDGEVANSSSTFGKRCAGANPGD